MRIYVEGVGVRGPGLDGWAAARSCLLDPSSYSPTPACIPLCPLLPAAERRRTVTSVNLALAVGMEALEHADRIREELPGIFSSSCGDGTTIHEIVEVLSTPEREVSPTRFHNSVHNAPAGYWSIATQSREPSTSLCCFDASFPAGLLEATVFTFLEQRPVILVVYDVPYPEPLNQVRPIPFAFGMALVLNASPNRRSIAALDVVLSTENARDPTMSHAALEVIRCDNPAARGLPLLSALAGVPRGPLSLEYVAGNRILVTVGQC
ncbi:MAG: beta-ketoacyl synthase chain length factor [Burkholderiaceae bacterium]|jgi:hypothetical protein